MKNYIWDFDGMLFDSYPHIAATFVKAMADTGVTVDYAESKLLLEDHFDACYGHYNVTDEQKAKHNAYEHQYDFEPIVVPFANTYRTLEALKERGANHFLYTHRGKITSAYYLEKYDMAKFFTACVDSSCGFPSKPAPDAVNYICETYGLDKSETVMVGDREIDVMSGKNAGTYGCLFTKAESVNTVADFVIKDIIEILTIEEEKQ